MWILFTFSAVCTVKMLLCAFLAVLDNYTLETAIYTLSGEVVRVLVLGDR